MTEKEAKTKWCPMMQKWNGPIAEFGMANCIGSACMMWRWIYTPSPESERHGQTVPACVGDGCCGLAGKS